jgi:uncharacterized protein
LTVYLDTSNLVKLYVEEPGRDAIVALVQRADLLATSVIAYAEARATFARRHRERLMSAAELKLVVRQFNTDWSRFAEINADREIAQRAGQLAEVHGLRGADALHLASFETLLSRTDDEDVEFSCADVRLSRAARRLR